MNDVPEGALDVYLVTQTAMLALKFIAYPSIPIGVALWPSWGALVLGAMVLVVNAVLNKKPERNEP